MNARRAPRDVDVQGLSVARAVAHLNAGRRLRFESKAEAEMAPAIIAAAGSGLPIYSLFYYANEGDAFPRYVALERADIARAAQLFLQGASCAQSSEQTIR